MIIRTKGLGPRATVIAGSFCYFALGTAIAAIGPALPDLAARTGSPLEALGGTFSAMFLGAVIAQLAAGPLGERFDQRPLLLAGLALFALGTLGYATSRALPLTLLCAWLAGLGQGTLVVGFIMLITRAYAGRGAAALNLSNVFFGAGDVAGPGLAGLALGAWGTATPALWIGAGLALVPAALVPWLQVGSQPRAAVAAGGRPIYRAPLLWGLALFALLYVGTEISVAGWSAAYLLRTTALNPASAALITSGFWLAVTLGRVFGVVLGARLSPNRLLLLCLGGALGGGLLMLLSIGDASPTIAAVLLIGLFFGPIFPTTMALAADSFPDRPGSSVSIVSAMGSLGGMLLPWLQGNLLVRGGPSASALLVAFGTLAMLMLHVGRRLLARRPARLM